MSGLSVNTGGIDPLPTQSPTANSTTPSMQVIRCKYFNFDYDIAICIVCGMYLIFGVVYTLFGYRCFKAVMFLTGFIFASCVVYLICLEEDLLPTGANAGVALGTGLLFGLITMLVQYVGLFMTGLHSGVLVGIIVLAVMHIFYTPDSIWVPVGLLIGCGLLSAIFTLCWQKVMTIFSTCLYGGAIMSLAIDYFIEKFTMVYWMWDRIRIMPKSDPLCWISWIILATWPFMVLTGLLTQWKVTGRGTYHQQLAPPSKSQQVNLQKIRERNERAEQKQKKYRYLYQVRTAHGDVISQSYIQWLQNRVCDEKTESTAARCAGGHLDGSQTAPLNPSDTSITNLSQMP